MATAEEGRTGRESVVGVSVECGGSVARVAWRLAPLDENGERGEKWRQVLPLVTAYCAAFDEGEPIEAVLMDMIADMLHLLDHQGGNEHAADVEQWDVVTAVGDLLDRAVRHWWYERSAEVSA